jgi:hypothetical protein
MRQKGERGSNLGWRNAILMKNNGGEREINRKRREGVL